MTLDHFEQSLLTDLREHVAERAAVTAPARSRRWRWAAVPVGVASAVTALVVLLQPSGAYAVTQSGSEVVVSIKRLDDSAGLEKALADHGIKADVDYSAHATPPPGDSGQRLDSGSSSGPSDKGPSLQSSGGAPGGGGGELPKISSSIEDGVFTLRIDRDSLPADAELHITTSGSTTGNFSGLQVMFTREK